MMLLIPIERSSKPLCETLIKTLIKTLSQA